MHRTAWTLAGSFALLAGLAAPALAQVVQPDGTLYYPPGAKISRALTPVEREYLKTHTLSQGGVTDIVTPPPTGPVHCAAEYEPTDGIIISWTGGFYTIQG